MKAPLNDPHPHAPLITPFEVPQPCLPPRPPYPDAQSSDSSLRLPMRVSGLMGTVRGIFGNWQFSCLKINPITCLSIIYHCTTYITYRKHSLGINFRTRNHTICPPIVGAEWLRSSPARIGRIELLLPSPKTALPGGNRSPTGVPGIPWT